MAADDFEVGASGINVAQVLDTIRASVQRKKEDGVYDDPVVARAERANLSYLASGDESLAMYLDSLRESAQVDINDFEIIERRRSAGKVLVWLKRTIWKTLKFYTYRLWSQQNEVNGLLLSALEGLEQKYHARVQGLEERVKHLESRVAARGATHDSDTPGREESPASDAGT